MILLHRPACRITNVPFDTVVAPSIDTSPAKSLPCCPLLSLTWTMAIRSSRVTSRTCTSIMPYGCFGNRKAVVIHVPYCPRKPFKEIHVRLVR